MRTEPVLTAEARILRQAMTPAEGLLWQALRNRGVDGLKFRRGTVVRTPAGSFVAPFLCAGRHLIVDLHPCPEPGVNDLHRQAAFRAAGWQVLVLTETAVLANPSAILRAISKDCAP